MMNYNSLGKVECERYREFCGNESREVTNDDKERKAFQRTILKHDINEHRPQGWHQEKRPDI